MEKDRRKTRNKRAKGMSKRTKIRQKQKRAQNVNWKKNPEQISFTGHQLKLK